MEQKELVIGDLRAKIPVIQGGMGVGISLSGLAGAVAAAGGIGIISTAQVGFREPGFAADPIGANLQAIGREIAKARETAPEGIIGVNIMVATRRYEDYVRAAVEAGADLIISGAGLPMMLPELVKGSRTKILPIVSSRKAFDVITRYWWKKYNRLPDGVVVEGPRAGGHLGFSREELNTYTPETYDEEIKRILSGARELGAAHQAKIPVIVAGGIYERKDMDHYLAMGASGVQMGTRFVTTYECDAAEQYKQAYINAGKEDIVIVDSPVGMPGRALQNPFLDRVKAGERFMKGCRQCISTCKPQTSPYCITEALVNAAEGRTEEGLIFCGSNAWRASKIESVQEIMEEFA